MNEYIDSVNKLKISVDKHCEWLSNLITSNQYFKEHLAPSQQKLLRKQLIALLELTEILEDVSEKL